MPVCPKCHDFISEQHWERHLERCGVHHKHEPMPLIVNSGGVMGATPYAPNITPPAAYPWWKFGPLVWPPRKLTRRQKVLLLFYALLASGILSLIALFLLAIGL